MEITEKLKRLQEEKDYWNSTAMDLLHSKTKLNYDFEESLKIMDGLLDDFKYFIGECDKEPQRAGYIREAEKFLSKNKK